MTVADWRRIHQLFTTLTGAITLLAVLFAMAAPEDQEVSQPHPFNLPACQTEDAGVNCVWDAKHRGNGQGQTLWYDQDGRIHYLP